MTKTKVRTNPGALPTHRGLPVPWVVRWTAERPPSTPQPSIMGRAYTPEGKPFLTLDIPGLERTDDGWLWCWGREDRSGTPEFSQVHPIRQRRCMDEHRCQICGLLIRDWRDEIFVLADTGELPPPGEPAYTASPPVHRKKCLDLSRRMCPHLKQAQPPAVTAMWTEKWGVKADLYDANGTILAQVDLRDGHIDGHRAVARQRILALHGWRAE